MRLCTFTEYTQLEIADIDWVIPGMVPKGGNIVLLGAPKAGKSLFTVQMCLSIVQGRTWHGFPTTPHSILYLQMDTPVAVWKHMIDKILAAGVSLDGDLFIPHPEDFPKPYNITDPEFRKTVKGMLDKINPDIVVLDVLRELHNMDENDSTQMKNFSDYLEVLFKGRTLIQIHHTRKLPDNYKGQNPVNASRGSSYLTGKSDAFWLLHNDKVYVTPRFRETFTMEFGRDNKTGFFIHDGCTLLEDQTPKVKEPPKEDETLPYLKDLVLKYPLLTKAQVYDQEQAVLTQKGVSRSTFFRKLAGWFPDFSSCSSSPVSTSESPAGG